MSNSTYGRKATLNLRVAARYLRGLDEVAMEFDSPEAMRKYLEEHPGADKSLHHVKKPDVRETPGKDETKEPDKGHDHEEKPAKSWRERLKGLKDSAVSFVKSAPEAVKKFVTDDASRRETLMRAHDTLVKAPEKVVRRVVDTVKEEVHEYKVASEGVRSVLRGGKMDDHQKKAFKTVAFHLALGLTAAALTATGAGIAGTFAKGMTKHVAYKAVTRSLGNMHVLEEMGHVGHGVAHFMSHMASEDDTSKDVLRCYVKAAENGADVNPDAVMGDFIAAAVAKELSAFDDEQLTSVLNGTANKQ